MWVNLRGDVCIWLLHWLDSILIIPLKTFTRNQQRLVKETAEDTGQFCFVISFRSCAFWTTWINTGFCCHFWDKGSGWSPTCYIAKDDPEFLPPVPLSWGWRWQARATFPNVVNLGIRACLASILPTELYASPDLCLRELTKFQKFKADR